MRHRASSVIVRVNHETTQDFSSEKIDRASLIVCYLHMLLSWIPSRLLLVGYMLAGSFDGGILGAKQYYSQPKHLVSHLSTDILIYVGRGAIGDPVIDSLVTSGQGTRSAATLVHRALWLIWCPALAILTITDWLF
jgi:hypothetical protein